MLNVIMLNAIMQNVIILNAIMQNVIMLNVIMLIVVAPYFLSLLPKCNETGKQASFKKFRRRRKSFLTFQSISKTFFVEAKAHLSLLEPFQPCIILASKASVSSSGAPFRGLACKYLISKACEEQYLESKKPCFEFVILYPIQKKSVCRYILNFRYQYCE